jgi:hypothetical protein
LEANWLLNTHISNVFFLLSENVWLSLESGVIGHIREMPDILPLGKRFLICDSLHKRVLGPFVVTKEQFKAQVPPIFKRRVHGTVTIEKECPWLFGFAKVPEIAKTEIGLEWKTASRRAGIPEYWWASIRQHRLSDRQFVALCNVLIEANQAKVPLEGLVPFSVYKKPIDTNEQDYADFYKEGIAPLYGPEGDPANEAAIVEMMYGGSLEAYLCDYGE